MVCLTCFDINSELAILTSIFPGHIPPKVFHNELETVTYPQDGQAAGEEGRVIGKSMHVVNTTRASRDNDSSKKRA